MLHLEEDRPLNDAEIIYFYLCPQAGKGKIMLGIEF